MKLPFRQTFHDSLLHGNSVKKEMFRRENEFLHPILFYRIWHDFEQSLKGQRCRHEAREQKKEKKEK